MVFKFLDQIVGRDGCVCNSNNLSLGLYDNRCERLRILLLDMLLFGEDFVQDGFILSGTIRWDLPPNTPEGSTEGFPVDSHVIDESEGNM